MFKRLFKKRSKCKDKPISFPLNMADVIANIAYNNARSSFGIYPQATILQDGTKIDRTEYQNGWNDGYSHFIHNVSVLKRFYSTLEPSFKKKVLTLAENQWIYASIEEEDQVKLYANMNDTFYPGADMEGVFLEDIDLLYHMNDKYSYHGLTAWVSYKRKDLPLEEHRTEFFFKALEELEILNGKGIKYG